MGVADLVVEEIQEQLDCGYNPTKIASMLGLNHKQVGRAIKKHKLEIYVAFDDYEDRKHPCQNLEWLWGEDKLEDITNEVFDTGFYLFPEERTEDIHRLSNYCKETYGDFKEYLKRKKLLIISDLIHMKCPRCGEIKSINNYYKNTSFMGLDARCLICYRDDMRKYRNANVVKVKQKHREWIISNKDRVILHQHRRRARVASLPDTLTVQQYNTTLAQFDYACALTGKKENLEKEHAIPISVGHGGTTVGNCYPMVNGLNQSKNDSNIFEWFKANRQRFELSQERFDKLIAYLASANAMTVEEYRDYVYWCHANPRGNDEIGNADGGNRQAI